MPQVTIETGLSIYYEIEGEGKPLVLVQALDRDHNGMVSQRKELSRFFQVISFDARGTGQSDTPEGPYSCRQMAEDIYGLLKALGVDKVHLIGASLGGQIVQEFAINFPEMTEKIVLMCTISKSDHYLKSLGGFWNSTIEKMGHAHLCEEIMHWSYTRTYFEEQKSRLDAARQKLKELDPSYNMKGFQWKVEAGINADTADRLHKIKAPTLIMAGELDFFISPSLSEQQLAKNIAGSRFQVIKGAAHAFYEEKPDEVNKAILSFLTTE